MTRHGPQWVDWLVWRPDLNFRNPQKDPRLVKSGVYHFGGRCGIGDPDGKVGPGPTQDPLLRSDPTYVFQQPPPGLLAKYVEVSKEVSKSTIPCETRRTHEPFIMRAIIFNLMAHEQRVESRVGCAAHGVVREWACHLGKTDDGRATTTTTTTTTTSSGTPSPFDSCLDVKLEDILPENSEDEDEQVRITERPSGGIRFGGDIGK
ncbi:hypothetical protein DL771_008697 [Monosporascus sp. 5C6A]|nr:hypothetical protein DL771_008697 [Monosporascus sp. 5C6A]